jgi:hypothetical protein
MLNKELRDNKKQTTRVNAYFIEAPRAISANFGFVKKNKEKRDFFRKIKELIESKEGQQIARDNGYRSVKGGIYKKLIWAGLHPVGSASNELKLQDSELQTIFSYYQSKIRPPSKVNVVLNLEEKVGEKNNKLHNEIKERLIEIGANDRPNFFLASTKKDEFKFVLSKKDPEKIDIINFKDSSGIGDEFRTLRTVSSPNHAALSVALTKAISDLCDSNEEVGQRSVILISDNEALDNQMKNIQLLVKGCRKKVNFYIVYIGNKKETSGIVSDYSAEKILQPKVTMYITEDNARKKFWKLRGYL